jgi:hypothetical protein
MEVDIKSDLDDWDAVKGNLNLVDISVFVHTFRVCIHLRASPQHDPRTIEIKDSPKIIVKGFTSLLG